MAKPNPLDRRLAALYSLEDAPASIAEKLPPFFRDKSNIVIAKAANMAVRVEASGLAAELAHAFTSLLEGAAAMDPGCVALTAIAKALVTFDAPAAEAYFAGLRHFQWEASFGRQVEVAGELRGLCARGIVRMRHPEALLEILPLLADTLPARIGAVRAIAETGTADAELLLRLHVIRGDSDPEVVGECFTALLGLMAQRSLGFVAGYLRSDSDEVAEMAALALGESRMTAAFPVLRDAWLGKIGAPVRRAVLFALAMLRRDEAFEFMLSLLDKYEQDAAAVISALAIHKDDVVLRDRLAQTLKTTGRPHLDALFKREWGAKNYSLEVPMARS
jgi:HEAT repeat protein